MVGAKSIVRNGVCAVMVMQSTVVVVLLYVVQLLLCEALDSCTTAGVSLLSMGGAVQ